MALNGLWDKQGGCDEARWHSDEGRHRSSPDEIEPVRDAALARLLALLEDRDAGSLDEAQALFRVWFRIHYYVRNKPSYLTPRLVRWIPAQLTYGTEKEAP